MQIKKSTLGWSTYFSLPIPLALRRKDGRAVEALCTLVAGSFGVQLPLPVAAGKWPASPDLEKEEELHRSRKCAFPLPLSLKAEI